MLDLGWEAEVRELMERIPPDAPAWNASGYGTIRRLVAGEVDRSAAIDAIVIETRQYAKRQRTWFRHQLGESDVTHLDPDRPDADVVAEQWWSSGGEGNA